MKIYTRTGDDGTTGLFGGGRVSKDHIRIRAYGTVDELNSVLGQAGSLLTDPRHEKAASVVRDLQHSLFVAGADLATPNSAKSSVPRIDSEGVFKLEGLIDDFEVDLDPLKAFILPGGSQVSAVLHLGRTVCRRAERNCVSMVEVEGEGLAVAQFLNRLSDLLFVMARWTNKQSGIKDIPWLPEN